MQVPPTPAQPLQRLAAGILCLLAGLVATGFLLWTALLWYRYHTHIPWRDLFLIVKQVQSVLTPGFDTRELLGWFDLHYNAHRIFLLRALVALDLLWFHGQNHLLYSVGWLCLLLMLAINCISLHSRHWPDACTPLTAAFIVAIYLFGPAHLWNLVNPVNVSWHLTMAMALSAFYLLLRSSTSPPPTLWLAAFVAASAAAFSTFAGVIAWLLLPLLALYLRSRYTPLVLVACLLAVYLYSRGLSSDAAVLANWNSGKADALAQIHAQGREALAANGPRQILSRAIAFLGLPLGLGAPRLANALVLASLLPVGWTAWSLARNWLRRAQRPPLLCELALATALFCLGVALVTQLGRIIPQPVHVLGPSQERFQSVVLCYWAAVSLLLVHACAGLKPALRLAGSLALLCLALLITAPWGSYLKQEILSMEYAARLQSLGEFPALRDAPGKTGLNFQPERIFQLDELLARHQLAYRLPISLPRLNAPEPACGARVSWLPGADEARDGYVATALQLAGWPGLLAREVLVAEGGAAIARLYPVHRGDYTPWQLWQADKLDWSGYLPLHAAADVPRELLLGTPLGLRAQCSLAPTGND